MKAIEDGQKESALRNAEIVYLYCHGNAANRAAPLRVTFARALVESNPSTHVLAIDYRGFGDSSGSPTEREVQLDVDAAYAYLLGILKDPAKIIVLGHSLGKFFVLLYEEKSSLNLKKKARRWRRDLCIVYPIQRRHRLL